MSHQMTVLVNGIPHHVIPLIYSTFRTTDMVCVEVQTTVGDMQMRDVLWKPVDEVTIQATVECSCGAEFVLDSQEEIDHYVWAKRSDGSRSNLGYCPITEGIPTAMQKASRALYAGVWLPKKGWN
jgi:hypothetical protein